MQLVNGLNLEQKQASSSRAKNTLVVASAGTGKTSTIMARVEYLLNNGALPQEILLITFTNKAAIEMKKRLLKYFNHGIVEKINAGTFHAISLNAIKPFYSNLKILGDAEHRVLVRTAYSKVKSELKIQYSNIMSPHTLAQYFKTYLSVSLKYDDFYEYIYTMLEKKDDNQNIAELINIYSDIYREFKGLKIAGNLFEFDDLIQYAIDFQEKLSIKHHKHLIIDEYQDTNPLQEALSKTVHYETMFCVGDYDQSIYAFNGADIDIISNFTKKHKNSMYYNLFRNYRSAPKILGLAERVIANNPRIYPKELKAEFKGRTGNEDPQYFKFETTMEQFESIAAYISSIPIEKRGDVAILYRGNSSAAGAEIALNSLNVEYDRKNSSSFFNRIDIQIILATLKLSRGTFDYKDLLVAYQDCNIKHNTLEQFYKNIKLSNFSHCSYPELANNTQQYSDAVLLNLHDYIDLRKKCSKIKKPASLIKIVFDSGLFMKLIKRRAFPEGKKTDYHQYQLEEKRDMLINAAYPHKNLDLFLKSLIKKPSKEDVKNNKVQLMSVHSSKGLEFDTVFLVDLTSKMFPNSRLMNAGGSLEEERRLFYVAVTRAKNTLWLCYPTRDARNTKRDPSCFLIEAGFR